MHSPYGIFDVTVASLDPENVDFDVIYAIRLTLWITLLCVIVLMSAILENSAVRESHTLPTMSSSSCHQFRDPHTPMIDFRYADKCLYSAANYSKTIALFRPLLQHYNRKWPMGNQMVTWPMTSHDPKSQVHDPNTVRAQYLENSWRFSNNLATIANY